MSISIVSAKRNEMPSSLLRGMYKLRHDVFNKRLHWDVEDFGELEIDQFDYQNPKYIVAQDDIKKIIGCWRLIPTTETYMLEDVFKYLLGNDPLPKQKNIWELSRFAVVDKRHKGFTLSEATVLMINEIIDFALEKNISGYLAVTSVGIERLMKSVDIPIKRIGVKKPVDIGGVKSVLCYIPVNEKFIQANEKLVSEYTNTKIAA